jgi:hypothetical protein
MYPGIPADGQNPEPDGYSILFTERNEETGDSYPKLRTIIEAHHVKKQHNMECLYSLKLVGDNLGSNIDLNRFVASDMLDKNIPQSPAPQEIEFAFTLAVPTAFVDGVGRVRNVRTGPDIEALKRFLLLRMPAVGRNSVTTYYRVLFTEREVIEGRSAKTRALVEVYCTGNHINEWTLVEGLYLIRLESDCTGTKINASRLVESDVLVDSAPAMPRIRQIYYPPAA